MAAAVGIEDINEKFSSSSICLQRDVQVEGCDFVGKRKRGICRFSANNRFSFKL